MRKVKWFGFTEDQIEDFLNIGEDADFIYTNKQGEDYVIHVEPGGIGYELWDYETKSSHQYKSFEEMLNNHIMPDGVSLIDVWNGENYYFDEG